MLKEKHYLISLIYLLSIVTSVIRAQSSASNFPYIANIQHFSEEDGLSYHIINDLGEDRRGVPWLATRYGLNRFDGQSFKVFNKEDGLYKDDLGSMFIDQDVIWFFEWDRTHSNVDTIWLFHTLKEEVITVDEYLGYPMPFNPKEIVWLMEGEEKLFFKAVNEREKTAELFYVYSFEDGFQVLDFLEEGEEIISCTQSEIFWIGFDKGEKYQIRKVDKRGKELQKVELDFLKSTRTDFRRIELIHEAPDQSVWLRYFILQKARGIFKIEGDGMVSKIEEILIGKEVPSNLKWDKYNELKHYPNTSAFWFTGSNKNGLVNLNGKILYETPKEVKSFGHFYIHQDVILLPGSGGFFQIDLKKNKFQTLFTNAGQSLRGISNIGNSVFVNCGNGVFQLEEASNVPPVKILPRSFGSMADRSGNLWVGLGNLRNYDPDTKETSNLSGLNAGETWSLFEDRNGKIWFQGAEGLACYNPTSKELELTHFNEFRELQENLIYHFFEKKDGNILICSTSGMYEMDLQEGIISRYWTGGKGKYYLPADEYSHLYYDNSKDIYWLASRGKGLIEWNPSNGSYKEWTLKNLKTNIVHSIYADEFGFFWMSTDNGIVQFDRVSKDFKVYTSKDGTSSHEFNRISHCQSESGKIYFGSIDGLTIFDPIDFKDFGKLDKKVAVIVLELNQYERESETIENLTNDLYVNREIDLDWGDRFFNLKLTTSDLTYAKEAIFYHKIKNEDKVWIEASSNELAISGLPLGNQVLQIRALLSNGQYTEILEIPVNVGKPIYMEWWFITMVLMIGVLITLMVTYYRTKKLKEQKLLLEHEVEKRTQKINEDKLLIEKQAEELKELDQTKSRFFANISHELRTPITLILGPIESALKSKNLDGRNFNFLNKAKQNSHNLLRLVNEILDLTKLESNKLYLEESTLVFYTFLKRVVANFESIADTKSIKFVFQYHGDTTLQVELDKEKLERVINNLLSNAFKFTPEGGRIEVDVDAQGAGLFISVKDNGRGIPSEDIPFVFNRFYQSSLNKKLEGGLGIGLALSKEYIKLMNGDLRVESNLKGEEKGSIFFVRIPKKEVISMLDTADNLELELIKKEEKQKADLKAITTSPVNKGDSLKQTILLVEDNKDIRVYLSELLSEKYEILEAENGAEALKILNEDNEPTSMVQNQAFAVTTKTQEISLIISDIMMPVMDGYELLQHLKNEDGFRHIPTIMLTARANSKDRLKALRIGVDDYLVKPFDQEELQVRIENLLNNAKERHHHLKEEENNGVELKRTINQADAEWLENLENYLLNALGEFELSSDRIAHDLFISRTQLFQKVKQLTGLTLQQYIKEIRLEKARTYLSEKKYKTVKEVAFAIGLKDLKTFRQNFKKRFGITPSSYL